MLGVRPSDITPDVGGMVNPNNHGMSVAPSVAALPFMFVPRKYSALVEGAAGNDKSSVWEMGEGPFHSAPIDPMLSLKRTDHRHGVIGPRQRMPLQDFKDSLAKTQPRWRQVQA
jgi:hypothetical protein